MNLLVDVGFNKEVAKDAALYWSRESGSLEVLINSVDDMSVKKIHEFGERARNRVFQEYTWKIICDKYKRVFKIDDETMDGK